LREAGQEPLQKASGDGRRGRSRRLIVGGGVSDLVKKPNDWPLRTAQRFVP
jgi:hypothetical protein